MRLLGADVRRRVPATAILNIHPSLLPAFPGVDAQRQAWTHGVKVAGRTVHLVNEELDAGPIVLQAAVPVLDDDTARDAGGAHPRRGAPHLPGSDRAGPRRRLAHRGPARRLVLTASTSLR